MNPVSSITGEPRMPEGVKLHDYQIEAIENWKAHNYCGIFDMATGTGKTFTGLGAIVRLFTDKKRLAVIIVCPYQHLVEQWVEDIKKFCMQPVVGYSSSAQRDWKRRLSDKVSSFILRSINILCFVTTNATFATPFVQDELKRLGKDTLLLVDEAHNFGADRLSRTLNESIQYRLALSATLERHRDPGGTQLLYHYFGEKCIEYGLERAIREKKLTPYYYYPKVVYLADEELAEYRDLSKRIAKQCRKSVNGSIEISDFGKRLLIERSRIVAGASGKIPLLKQVMQQYKNDSHILVYCGAAREFDFTRDASEQDAEGERQIVAVSKMLGLELGMKVVHFTSAESAREREQIKEQFSRADPYQAIVAIKCLDEGVNIPSIKTAFILASSTNPKEYIQRRGRVLRRAKGKHYATIYDFVTLPRHMSRVTESSEALQADLGLIKKEISRMKEFGELSKNPSEADRLIKEFSEVYGLNLVEKGVDFL